MKHLYLLAALALPFMAFAGDKDPLKDCWKKQAKPLQGQHLQLDYTKSQHWFGHDQYPWKQSTFYSRGFAVVDVNTATYRDTLVMGTRNIISTYSLYDTALLYKANAYNEPAAGSRDEFGDVRMEMATFSPVPVLAYFQKAVTAEHTVDKGVARYFTNMAGCQLDMFINIEKQQVEKVLYKAYDEFYGDVTTTIYYRQYAELNGLAYPTQVIIEKLNGRLADTVEITQAQLLKENTALIPIPKGYNSTPQPKDSITVQVEHYSSNIHLLYMPSLNDRALVVEYDSFLLVAETPLSSKNGELLIKEAHYIAPRKPIKYFVFGHHHPHYLGGMRAFVHKGATVLTTPGDTAYLRYLATAPHTLKPDSQQLDPKPLKTQLIKDSLVIKDAHNEMRIYHIGAISGHTDDYLVYYFPKARTLFEDDLVWIPEGDAPLKKASERERGLFRAIKNLGLPVDTILQSWTGSGNSDIKYRIPLSELEKKLQVKE